MGLLINSPFPTENIFRPDSKYKFIDVGVIFPFSVEEEVRTPTRAFGRVFQERYESFNRLVKTIIRGETFYVSPLIIFDQDFKVVALSNDKREPTLLVNLGSFLNKYFTDKYFKNPVFVENLNEEIERVFFFNSLKEKKETEIEINNLINEYLQSLREKAGIVDQE